MTSQTPEYRGIPDHAKKNGPRMVQFKPSNPQETSTKGFRMANGQFVVVPRNLRKAITTLFETANKTGIMPEQLRGVLNYALDTAIAQGAQMARLMEEQMEAAKKVEFADDSDLRGWEVVFDADKDLKPELVGVHKDCPDEEIAMDLFSENRDEAETKLNVELAKWHEKMSQPTEGVACDANG